MHNLTLNLINLIVKHFITIVIIKAQPQQQCTAIKNQIVFLEEWQPLHEIQTKKIFVILLENAVGCLKQKLKKARWICINGNASKKTRLFMAIQIGDLLLEMMDVYLEEEQEHLDLDLDFFFASELAFNNKFYEKVDLAGQINSKTVGLLFSLRNKINCPQKVKREIMNASNFEFQLDSCEVFAIKK
eukprot:TRINITY_DN3314_c0_g2_i3.p1 TRINITY_DN3314_c0_g2~~TRINITY_DN3314_c0_g2_i3.p1  ORF type:complete len:187 (+),score=29.20 TRINITY_DN3314_c0_g2_i3:259-819(+)